MSETRWMVLRQAFSGPAVIMRSGCKDQAAAQIALKEVLEKQTKVHHQTYSLEEYSLGTLERVVAERGLLRQDV